MSSEQDPQLQARQRAYSKIQQQAGPTGDIASEEFSDLAAKYAYLVHRWARRYAGTSAAVIDWDDLVSVGMMGLIQAQQRFDPSSGKPFEAYAEFRIKGAILDELRRVDPFSQPLRRKVRRLARAVEVLANELGREPSEAELAEHLEIPIDQVRTLLTQAQEFRHTSVDEIDRHALSRDLAVSGWSRADLKVALGQGIRELDERSQMIVGLYYFQGLSMGEIGRTLGVTEARISQLHSAAIAALRLRIAHQPGDAAG